ncbi:MAG: YgiT-type zinc finger protein [Deltaproteobacteria bacterium]|nr:YgiT-type zinc finger protein [Deltaproteobacteria bacterium]
MICPDCKKEEMVKGTETIRYEESGLPNVVLKDIPLRRCANCGNQLVSIPNLAGLHRCIAVALVNKPERLTPLEIGFLRKSLGWSKADFARKLHVRPEQVSRWESSKAPVPMQVQSELLLRSLVAMGQKIDDYKDHMEELASKTATEPSIVSLGYDDAGWHKLAA